MNSFIQITSAMADSNRARALMSLLHGELCLCQVTELLQLATSTVSKHLAVLKSAGLVESRKQGRWMYYRMPGSGASPEVKAALRWAINTLQFDPQITADLVRLNRICAEDLEAICRRQSKKRACCSSAPATPAAPRWPKGSLARSKAT